jgi:PHD/YefM family antitoxin component YafN of YafNO toxin-antitoxin module
MKFTAKSLVGESTETTTMIRPEDIGSLTDFNRNSKAHVKRLKRTGRPELLTVNGKAEVVVQSAAAYQRLLTLLENLKRDLQGRPEEGGQT